MRHVLLCALIAALSFAACDPVEKPESSNVPIVDGPILASTWPLASMASAIIGTERAVQCMVPEGADPAFWQPDDEALLAIHRSPLLILNGADFESWPSTSNLLLTGTLYAGNSFKDAWVEIETTGSHSHGASGAHSHTGHDPHFWMDPLLALEQARAIKTSAVARTLVHASVADPRLAELETRLRALDATWVKVGKALEGRMLVANHNTYTYPARRYGLQIVEVHLEPDGEIDATTGNALDDLLVRNAHPFFLFEAPPSAELTAALKEKHRFEVIVLRAAEAPIEGADSAVDIWEADLQHLLERVTQ